MDGLKVHSSAREGDIAIVGMAAHFPGASSVEAYWSNLRAGLESIRRLSDEEILAAGEEMHLMQRPDYVPFAAPLDRFEEFDAEFFGYFGNVYCLSLISEGRISSDHKKPSDLGKPGNEIFGDTVRQKLLLWITRHVVER